ncbi:MAG: RHS repeat-associated core domain-containing protein [Tepidisphaeraceae bacterium]
MQPGRAIRTTDGKIVIAGRTGTTNSEFAVARLHAETTGGSTDVRHYAVQDANFNVTAVAASSDATVLERFQYDPYGQATVLDANFAADADGGSDLAWAYLHQGGRFDYDSGLYHFNNGGNGREYTPTLARWGQQDRHPEGPFVNGMNAYQYQLSSPTRYTDSTGMDVRLEGTGAASGQHRRVTVDTYDENCNKTGTYSISFGVDNGNPRAKPRGVVYQDTADPTHTADTIKSNCCQDREIAAYMQAQLGKRDSYCLPFETCRQYSQELFQQAKTFVEGTRSDSCCEGD